MSWTRRKSIEAMTPTGDQHRLARTLSWPHLLALGVGAIVGTGILTLIGVGADRACRPPLLRHSRCDLRLRRARLCRTLDHDARRGQRL